MLRASFGELLRIGALPSLIVAAGLKHPVLARNAAVEQIPEHLGERIRAVQCAIHFSHDFVRTAMTGERLHRCADVLTACKAV